MRAQAKAGVQGGGMRQAPAALSVREVHVRGAHREAHGQVAN